VIDDPALPPVALRIYADPEGCQVLPSDGVIVRLDGRRLASAASWAPGQQVAVGGALLDLMPYQPPDAALHSAQDGAGLEFNRPPRLLPPAQAARFSLPGPPGKPERRPVPVLMAAVPVVLGVAMAYLLHQVYMLAMAAFSPVMLLGSYLSEHRGGRKSYARQLAGYREHRPGWNAMPPRRCGPNGSGAGTTARIRPPRRRSRPGPGAGCGSAAAPTLTTCCCGSARRTCHRRWS
jgi:DNA segregation ATPase FtsK/SpoIIIE, S-DNA-T family